MYNMTPACRKRMHSFYYLKNIYMHILFCTAAKHLFGIKMCTPVSIVLSFKYYHVDLHFLTSSPEIMILLGDKGTRHRFGLPFHLTF